MAVKLGNSKVLFCLSGQNTQAGNGNEIGNVFMPFGFNQYKNLKNGKIKNGKLIAKLIHNWLIHVRNLDLIFGRLL